MALDATVGGASSNSYITVAEANTYYTDHMKYDQWDSISDADKSTALVMATMYLDQYFIWNGTRTTSTQALCWPRYEVVDIENDDDIENDEIPTNLKRAISEMALHLVENRQFESVPEVEEFELSKLKIKIRNNQNKGSIIPEIVRAYVADLGSIRDFSGSTFTPKLVRA